MGTHSQHARSRVRPIHPDDIEPSDTVRVHGSDRVFIAGEADRARFSHVFDFAADQWRPVQRTAPSAHTRRAGDPTPRRETPRRLMTDDEFIEAMRLPEVAE